MNIWKKALSVGLSLALCAGMVMPAFAASFSELNGAISGSGNGTFGANQDIRASTGEDGVRNVELLGNVTYGGDGDAKSIVIGEGQKVNLDLNGNTIDGGARFTVNEETLEVEVENEGSGSPASQLTVVSWSSRGMAASLPAAIPRKIMLMAAALMLGAEHLPRRTLRLLVTGHLMKAAAFMLEVVPWSLRALPYRAIMPPVGRAVQCW